MRLVIAEKPSVARDIATALGGRFERREGFLEGLDCVISWTLGHLLELAEPENYDPVLKRWRLDDLPIVPGRFKLVPVPVHGAGKQLRVLRELLNRGDVTEVINACDAGREGELIFRRVYEYTGCRKPVKRLWLSEATPGAVRAAFQALRAGEEFDNLAAAARARAEADWLVGINATRAFTVVHGTLLSVGRVQTPTLALVVAREREIRNFVPTPYWQVRATFRTESGETYEGFGVLEGSDRFLRESDARAFRDAVTLQGQVMKVERRERVELPPHLFNLNDLQREANRICGLTAQETLDAAQALYEKHKLITYPRTDSRHLPSVLVRETLAGRLAALRQLPEYAPLVPAIDAASVLKNKRMVDDTKVTDHHAIIPTAFCSRAEQLPPRERRIFDLVARRFLAALYPPARYEDIRVETSAGHSFLSRGTTVLDPGWLRVYPFSRKEGKGLPPLAEGEAVDVVAVEVLRRETEPPSRYTEAGLLAAMENAGRHAEDEEAAATLRAVGGIGTPATRAAIIERLIEVGYLVRKGKTLFPTEKGERLIDLVPEEVRSVELTARWEQSLAEVERGEGDVTEWLHGIIRFTEQIVGAARSTSAASRAGGRQGRSATGQVVGHCPVCGRSVVELPKSYTCEGHQDGCGFVVWKVTAGRPLGRDVVESLIQRGRSGLLNGFVSKSGKRFDAELVVGRDGRVVFRFLD